MIPTLMKRVFGRTDFDIIKTGRLFVPLGVLIGWAFLSLVVGPQILPGPRATLDVIVNGFRRGWLLTNLINTLTAIFFAYILAVVGGLTIGLILGRNKSLYEIFEIYVLSIYAVPKIIFFPVFLLLLGVTFEMKVSYGALSGFYPMLIITMSAIREVDGTYLSVADSLRLDRWQKFRHVIFPSILIQLVIALRLSFSFTFVGTVLVELIAAKSGLGLILQNTMEIFNPGVIMAVVAVIVFIATTTNLGFYAIQRMLERRWNLTVESKGGM